MSERFDLQKDLFDKMADFFYTNGYVILDNALDEDTISNLRSDLYNAQHSARCFKTKKEIAKQEKGKRHDVHKCFFEISRTKVMVRNIENDNKYLSIYR